MRRVEPSLPTLAPAAPPGPDWIHEIKHDGYRLMVRRDGAGIRLLTRNGHDWSSRYPLIVNAVNRLRCRSCVLDGEAVACDDAGMAVFQLLRRRKSDPRVFLYAFDLLELNGVDLASRPIETRKEELRKLLAGAGPGVQFVDHLVGDGDIVYRHACAMGLEGIVSKRLGSRYAPGRTMNWIKTKNPDREAAKRHAEEDWN